MIVKKSISMVFISLVSLKATSSLASTKQSTPPQEARQISFRGHSSSSVIIVEETTNNNDQQNKNYGDLINLNHNNPNLVLSTASTLYSSSLSSPSLKPSSSSSFIEWLNDHESSNPSILGTEKKKIQQISKDTYRCTQPSISWFGHHLVPVFVNKISRRSSLMSSSASSAPTSSNNAAMMVATMRGKTGKTLVGEKTSYDNHMSDHDHDYEYVIRVQLKESNTEFGGPQTEEDKKDKTVSLMKRLLEGSYFNAVNVIRCRRRRDVFSENDAGTDTGDGSTSTTSRVWEVSSDLALEVTIQLPKSRFLLLPPGFNAIGSKIVRRNCRKRSEEALQELKDEYLKWSSSHGSKINM